MFSMEDVKMIVTLSKSLPAEFTNSQYKDKFCELFGRHWGISPNLDTLRKYDLVIKVREEMIPITDTYEEYYFVDGFTVPAEEWDHMPNGRDREIIDAHGGRYPRWRERPDLPPVKICDGKRYYYKFDLEKLRDAMREIVEMIGSLGL